jgi:hypothetical protein
MTAPAPLGQNVINNHIAKRAPSRHDDAIRGVAVAARHRAISVIVDHGSGSPLWIDWRYLPPTVFWLAKFTAAGRRPYGDAVARRCPRSTLIAPSRCC